jgi:sulfate/thiosulfate transport system permease protein
VSTTALTPTLSRERERGNTARRSATTEAPWVRWTLIALALGFMTLFLFVPLATVFVEALKKGWGVYLAAITEPDARSAIRLTLLAPPSACR